MFEPTESLCAEMGLEITAKALALMDLPPSPREAHIMISLDAHRILGGGSISPASGPEVQRHVLPCLILEAKGKA